MSLGAGVAALGCASDPDSWIAGWGTGGTAGTAGLPAGSSGPEACASYMSITDPREACDALLADCPHTLEAFFETRADRLDQYEVYVGDELRELRTPDGWIGEAWVFDEGGALAGWQIYRRESSWGPCSTGHYSHGPSLSSSTTDPTTVHRCDLALDAGETGEVCDCPCPDPPPPDAVYEGSAACLTIAGLPRCAPTYTEQRVGAGDDAFVRHGCGLRTLVENSLACSYDDGGQLVGGRRSRGAELRDECPGVDAYSFGVVPPSCAEEEICYLGVGRPPDGDFCPSPL